MRHLKRFLEHKASYFDREGFRKFLPDKLELVTDNGEFVLKKCNLTINSDLIQFDYYHNTPDNHNGDVLADGEPDFVQFDLYFDKNSNGFKILVDITYGDSMMIEFSIEAPNKINIIHYDGIGSKYDPDTYFGFTDKTINDLVKFFNSFTHGLNVTKDDFKFIDKHPDSYKHDINNKDHYYTDDSELIEFGNKFEKN